MDSRKHRNHPGALFDKVQRRRWADWFVDVGAPATETIEPSSSDDNSDSRDGDPAFSSDNGDSSEAEQGRSSTSKQRRWSIKKEGRSWSWTFRKFPSRTELTSNTSPRPTYKVI